MSGIYKEENLGELESSAITVTDGSVDTKTLSVNDFAENAVLSHGSTTQCPGTSTHLNQHWPN
ncbi:hypothetical protein QBC35DRAFT_455631, partial [Podospora australis]